MTSFSPDQLTEAIHFARAHALRTADAMQFAAATDANRTVIGGAFVFVVSDKELLSAARASNMITLDPEPDDAMEWLRDLRLREGRQSE